MKLLVVLFSLLSAMASPLCHGSQCELQEYTPIQDRGVFTFITDRIVDVALGNSKVNSVVQQFPPGLHRNFRDFIGKHIRQFLYFSCVLHRSDKHSVAIFLSEIEKGQPAFGALPGALQWVIKGSLENALLVYCGLWRLDGSPTDVESL